MIRITSKNQLRSLRNQYKNFLIANLISLKCRELDESFSRLLGYRDFNHLIRLSKRFPNYANDESGFLSVNSLNPQNNIELNIKAELINQSIDDSLFSELISQLDSVADNSLNSLVSYLSAIKQHYIENDNADKLELRHYHYMSQSIALAINYATFTSYNSSKDQYDYLLSIFSGSYGCRADNLKRLKINQSSDELRKEVYGWLYDTGFGIRVSDQLRVFVSPQAVYKHKQVSGNTWSVTIEMFDGAMVNIMDIYTAIGQINSLWEDCASRGYYTPSEVPKIDLNDKSIVEITYSSTFRGKLTIS